MSHSHRRQLREARVRWKHGDVGDEKIMVFRVTDCSRPEKRSWKEWAWTGELGAHTPHSVSASLHQLVQLCPSLSPVSSTSRYFSCSVHHVSLPRVFLYFISSHFLASNSSPFLAFVTSCKSAILSKALQVSLPAALSIYCLLAWTSRSLSHCCLLTSCGPSPSQRLLA